MQNKRIYFIMAVALIVVAAAAFVGARLLNGQAGPLGLIPMGPGEFVSSINMIPAPELPKTAPEAQGTFVERKDNTIVLQTVSMEMGKGGVVISEASGGDSSGPLTSDGPGGGDGPKAEVVITNDTIIYRDATEMVPPSDAKETATVQQKVEEGTLDDLKSDTMLMVWGRKSGDRIIAEVLLYSTPVMIKGP